MISGLCFGFAVFLAVGVSTAVGMYLFVRYFTTKRLTKPMADAQLTIATNGNHMKNLTTMIREAPDSDEELDNA